MNEMSTSDTPTSSMEREKKGKEDIRHLTDINDSQADVSKGTEECSVGNDSTSPFHSVYCPTTVVVKYKKEKGLTKYGASLKQLLPVRVKTGPGMMMPVDQSGCLAFTCFSWLTPLVWRIFRKGLTQPDIYYCSPYDGCRVNGARLSIIWDQEISRNSSHPPSLLRLLLKFIQTRLILCCFMYIACLAFGFIGPMLFMRWLLDYVQAPYVDHLEGVTWTSGLILCELFRVVCFSLMWAINLRTAVRVSSGVMSLLYRKLIRIQLASVKSVGEFVDTFANDAQKVYQMVYNLPLLIGGPLLIIGAVAFTWWLIGPYCLVSLIVFILSYLFQYTIAKVNTYIRKKVMEVTDQRVNLMTELLTHMKFIKLHAWEKPMTDNIADVRAKERGLLEKCQYLQTLSASLAGMAPYTSTIFTILVYTLSGEDLTPAEAFTLVVVNFIAAHGIRTLPICIRDTVNGVVAIKRLQKILILEERESYTTLPSNPEHAVYLSKAKLAWDQTVTLLEPNNEAENKEINLIVSDSEKPCQKEEMSPALVLPVNPRPILTDISFIVPMGKLVGICGPVGSGKSSLLSALLGQMKILSGQVAVRGQCAYVPQQSWILRASLRDNILFGHTFISKKYYEAIYCCGLTEDVAYLPRGDQTEIGDRGVTLSGGQKQRVSLARALYADKELYLLDDPLSAVDGHVGRHVFQHCIKGALRERSVLFVTHQIQYLKECDSVVYMRDGKIIEQGTHEDLMMKESEYSALIQALSKDDDGKLSQCNDKSMEEKERKSPSIDEQWSPVLSLNSRNLSHSPSKTNSVSDVAESDVPDGHLIDEEGFNKGSISWDTYNCYIRAAGGYIVCLLVMIWYILHAATGAFSNWWLSHWLNQESGNWSNDQPEIIANEVADISRNPDIGFYQMVYGLSAAVMVMTGLILGFLFIKTSLRASSSLHDLVLIRISRSPMRFFETVPIGRVLNIFTRDQDEIDTQLPVLTDAFLQQVMIIISNLLLIVIVFPWFALPLAAIAALFIFMQRIFRVVMRDLKRQENISRSPIYDHIATTIEGISSIHAFRKQEDFMEKFIQLVDANNSPLYLFYCSMRWFATRMSLLCVVLTLITSLFAIFLKEDVDAAMIALAIALTVQMSGLYQQVTRLGCDVEARFTSVERIQSYIEELDSEGPTIVEKNRPPVDWPTRGRISMRDVMMRYRPGLPLALKGITFEIDPQEKVGIVGKSGAGKSSIGAVLFRLVDVTSGFVYIDGIDLTSMGLDDLRSRMSIIPQDPVLFKGTIRYNLDPVNQYTDMELWDVLERTHIKDKIMYLDGGLDAMISEGGGNFSAGEKQLLCMARALLKHSRVVLLDEATASIDTELDNLIQDTIREVFSDCTVLTIAHRNSTVMKCDRVMVLSDGKVVEFDKPSILLSNPNSHFSQLMTDFVPMTEL